MEYSIQQLARLAGLSTRTLRYYDQIGLLKPARVAANGYRIYGRAQVDLLQQILFYRELDMPLSQIARILYAPDFNRERALCKHLLALQEKKAHLESLIQALTKTINSIEGGFEMSDQEKFEGFKQQLIDDNERAYGQEIRRAYGEAVVEASNARVAGMSEAVWHKAEELNMAISAGIRQAMTEDDPTGRAAQETCDLHRQWLCLFWPDGYYSKQAHLGLAEMYCADERFKQYYEAIAPGAAAFLLEAMKVYCASSVS